MPYFRQWPWVFLDCLITQFLFWNYLRFDWSCLFYIFNLILTGNFKNNYLLLPTPLFVFWHTSIYHTIEMPSNVQELLLNLCFLGLTFFIAFISLNKLIIVVPIIVFIPYIYLLLSNKPIMDKLHGRRIIFYCFITQFLCFKVISDIIQLPWVYFKGLDTQFLCFKTIRKKNAAGSLRTALLHISCVFRWSGTYFRVY